MSSKIGYRVNGVVDRISGRGNAMLQPDGGGEEKNLGNLPRSIVGEKVTALTLKGIWAVCLNPEYTDKEYLSSFLDRGLSPRYITESEIAEWGDENAKSTFSNLLTEGDFRSAPPRDLTGGDVIEVEFLESDSENRWLAHYQSTIVYVEAPFAAAGLTLEVTVTTVAESYVNANISPPIEPQKEVTVGDELRVEPQVHDGEDTYAVFKGIPVHIPEICYPTGKEVAVGVKTVSNIHIAASFSAIDRESLPLEGTTISLDQSPKVGTSLIDARPFNIESPLLDDIRSSDICVTGITSTEIESVYDFRGSVSVDSGDEIVAEVEKVYTNQIIGRYQKMPVVFSHEGRLSNALIGENIAVQVDEVHPDRLIVSLAAPNSSSVGSGEDHWITVLGRSSDHALTLIEQTPIAVASSHLLQKGDELRVQLTEVHQGCIEGSVADLPDCPSEGGEIRLSSPGGSTYTLFNGIPVTVPEDLSIKTEVRLGVEAVNSDSILATVHGLPLGDPPDVGEDIVASIVHSSSSGTFALSDGIPVLLPIYGVSKGAEVVVRVTEVKAAYIQGFIASVESDEGIIEFSEYQGYVQSGTRDIRRESFADAAVHFNAAAEIGAEVSGITAAAPKYAGALSVVINSIRSGDIADAENAVEDAIEMVPEDIEDEEMQIPTEVSRLRLQAVGLLLEAIQGVSDRHNSNPLQHIYQESVARSPLREATQVLQEARTMAQGTQYEEMVPGILLKRVLWLADGEFSSSVHDLSGWTPDASPDMEEFVWAYQFLEDAPNMEGDASLGPEAAGEQVELSSLGADVDIDRDEPPAAETVEPDSADTEPVDVDGSVATETRSDEGPGSEVRGGSVQRSPDDSSASDDEEDRDEVEDTAVQVETVDKSSHASMLDTSSPETEESSATEKSAATSDSPLKVVTDVEPAEGDTDLSELRTEAEAKASSDPVRDTSPETTTVGSRYQRAPEIRDYALARADGLCECCGDPAPFRKPGGEPYLEVHHVDELGEGGEDHPDKVVALCPVCHKRVHHGEYGSSINSQLAEKLEDGLADVGVE